MADVYAARGIPRDLIRVVGYPVPPAPPAEPAADAPDVLFIGRLADNKGVHVLVDAAAQLPGVSVAIAGDGPARSALETRARDRGVESQIRFLGWIDPERRNALLRGSRLFVLPSLWDEPFGIVGVEALGAGLPVVASDAGGVGAWLDDGVTGTLVPRGDATLLAAAIRVLLSDEERRTRYADAARVAALRHSVDEHLASLLPALGLA